MKGGLEANTLLDGSVSSRLISCDTADDRLNINSSVIAVPKPTYKP